MFGSGRLRVQGVSAARVGLAWRCDCLLYAIFMHNIDSASSLSLRSGTSPPLLTRRSPKASLLLAASARPPNFKSFRRGAWNCDQASDLSLTAIPNQPPWRITRRWKRSGRVSVSCSHA